VRDKLKELAEKDYWVYGLKEDDFDYTIRLVETLIENNQKDLNVRLEQAKINNPEEEIFCEIQSDLAHYAWVDEQYLWQFCLWRLQGIFEGLIVHTFLPEPPKKQLIGLRAKLEAVGEAGFDLESGEESELMLWAKLRNALSHAPPEQYRPAPVLREDVQEYAALLKGICQKWRQNEGAQ
jgi:hypothetical protein